MAEIKKVATRAGFGSALVDSAPKETILWFWMLT